MYTALYYALFYEGGGGIPISFKRVDLASPSLSRGWTWHPHLVVIYYIQQYFTSLNYHVLCYAIMYSLLRRWSRRPRILKTGGGGILFSLYYTISYDMSLYYNIFLRLYVILYYVFFCMEAEVASTSFFTKSECGIPI